MKFKVSAWATGFLVSLFLTFEGVPMHLIAVFYFEFSFEISGLLFGLIYSAVEQVEDKRLNFFCELMARSKFFCNIANLFLFQKWAELLR